MSFHSACHQGRGGANIILIGQDFSMSLLERLVIGVCATFSTKSRGQIIVTAFRLVGSEALRKSIFSSGGSSGGKSS